jgi:hypothetical protein
MALSFQHLWTHALSTPAEAPAQVSTPEVGFKEPEVCETEIIVEVEEDVFRL